MMFGQTQETLRRNVLDPLSDAFPGRVEWRAGLNEAAINGRTVYVMGSGDVRAYRRIRGITLGGAYVDEASLCGEEFWNMLVSRLSVPGAKLFATTNPETPAHWLYRWIRRAADLDMRVFRFLLDDNPWLDPAYVAALKAEYVGVWYRRYILGQWIAAEGAIWPAFDPDRHVVSTLPKQLLRMRTSVDYGTVNPTVALLLAVGTARQGETERIYAAREWRWDSRVRARQKTDREYSADLRAWAARGYTRPPWQAPWGETPPIVGPSERLIVDPSAASLIVQLQADAAPGVTGANNEVALGLRSVSSLLAADRLRIHSSCGGLLEEIPAYSWDEQAAARGEEKPVKEADHGPDALRYGIMDLWPIWRHWIRSAAGPGR